MSNDNNKDKGKEGVRLFCSYCRSDSGALGRFKKAITLLEHGGLVSSWHDRNIPLGEEWEAEIDENLDQADIVVLLLSQDFLASKNCRKEMEKAFRLRKERGVCVIPIVLRTCSWKDQEDLAKLQAPNKGQPILEASKPDRAWESVYQGIKEIVTAQIEKKRAVNEDFWKKMTSVGTLAAGDGAGISLQRLFVYPALKDHTPDFDKVFTLPHISSEVFSRLDDKRRQFSLILGDDQSGKTALCQMLFTSHWDSKHIPVYIDGSDIKNDKVANLVHSHISRQYQNGKILSRVSNNNKVIIVDNFHQCGLLRSPKKRNLLLANFRDSGFAMVVLVSDNTVADFQTFGWKAVEEEFGIERYSIMPLGYQNRATLIKKWANVSEESNTDVQHMLARYEQPVRSMIAENYVPDYPFFIQSILQIMFGAGSRADADMAIPASVGYCYSAFIVHALVVKGGVQRDKTKTYINILTELASRLYSKKEQVGKLSVKEFDDFFAPYANKFNVSSSAEKARETLVKSGLLSQNLYELSFQEYIFYYFVSRRLANRLDNDREAAEKEISMLCENAHRKKCSGVVAFLIHHRPHSSFLIEELKKNLRGLFSGVQPAALTSKETRFFVDYIRNLPPPQVEKIRATESVESRKIVSAQKREEHDLQAQHQEDLAQRAEQLEDAGNPNKELAELTKSFRMLSIMGQILKNQEGEMPNETLITLSVDTQEMAFRILSWLYRDMESEPKFWFEFIEKVFLKKHFSDAEHMTKLEKMGQVETTFGMLAFQSALGVIDRIANAIGSNQLLKISKNAAEQIDTPAAHLVNFSIQGWYGKNLDIKKVKQYAEKWESENPIALHILWEVIETYCYKHKVDRATRGKLDKNANISHKTQEALAYKRSKENPPRK